jgi:hypothetical protein
MAIAIAAGGCALSVPPDHSARAQSPGYHPVALATFNGSPMAPGTHGRLVGYLRCKTAAPEGSDQKYLQRLLTYTMDFRIVDAGIDPLSQWAKARGVSRVFFHLDGARTSFADLQSFKGSDLVEIDDVRFSLEFSEGFGRLMLRMVSTVVETKPFEYRGAVITAVQLRDDSSVLLGRRTEQFGGWLMTEAG